MAIIVAANNLLRVVWACKLNDQIGLNVRYFFVGAAIVGSPTLQQVADELDDVFSALYRDWLGTSAEYLGCSAQRVSPTASIPQVSTTNAGSGTGGASDVPAQVSGCLTLKTDLPGRKNRGRMYVPFPGHDMVDPPFGLTSSGSTRLTAFGTALQSAIPVVNGGDECNVAAWIVDPETFDVRGRVTSYRANDKLATQRRRGAYGRTNAAPF